MPLPSPALSRNDQIRRKGRAEVKNRDRSRDGDEGAKRQDGSNVRLGGDTTEEEDDSVSSFGRYDSVPEWGVKWKEEARRATPKVRGPIIREKLR